MVQWCDGAIVFFFVFTVELSNHRTIEPLFQIYGFLHETTFAKSCPSIDGSPSAFLFSFSKFFTFTTTINAGFAPASRMCLTNARVSIPSTAGTLFFFKKEERDDFARKLLEMGEFSFTMNPER